MKFLKIFVKDHWYLEMFYNKKKKKNIVKWKKNCPLRDLEIWEFEMLTWELACFTY